MFVPNFLVKSDERHVCLVLRALMIQCAAYALVIPKYNQASNSVFVKLPLLIPYMQLVSMHVHGSRPFLVELVCILIQSD